MRIKIVTTLLVTLLTTSAFADDVELICAHKNSTEDGSSVTFTLLNNIEGREYKLLQEKSGYNSTTGKSTRNVDFLQKKMACTLNADHSFQCKQWSVTDPHDTYSTFTLSKNPGVNSYSLEQYSTYQEYRTGRWVKKTETLSQNLFCK